MRAEFREPTGDWLGQAYALGGDTVLWAHGGERPETSRIATLTHVLAGWSRAKLSTAGPVLAAALAPGDRVLATAATRRRPPLGRPGRAAAARRIPPSGPACSAPHKSAGRRKRSRCRGRCCWTPGLTLPGPPGADRRELAFAPDGRRLLAGGAAGTVRLWDVPEVAPAGRVGQRGLARRGGPRGGGVRLAGSAR